MLNFGLLGGTSTPISPIEPGDYIWYSYDYDDGYAVAEDGNIVVDQDTVTPNFDGKAYASQGLKFNGVDQYADAGSFAIDGLQGFVMASFSKPVTSETDKYIYSKMNNGAASTRLYLRVTNDVIFIGLGAISHIDTGITVDDFNNTVLLYDNDNYSIYNNGILLNTGVYTNTVGVSNTTHIGNYSYNDTSFTDSIISNVVFSNGTVDATQIAYQFNNPEKFLYREDNILKSDILTQTEIDNVVAYLPLCETDGYVRDLVGYSKVVQIDDSFSGTTKPPEWLGGVETTWDVAGEVHLGPTSSTSPYIQQSLGLTAGTRLLVEVDVDIISGRLQIRTAGDSNTTGYAYYNTLGRQTIKVSTLEYNNDTDGFRLGANEIGSEWICYSCKVNTEEATYPITNYLDTMRTGAQHMRTGLNQLRMIQDSLGVPTALVHVPLARFDGTGHSIRTGVALDGTVTDFTMMMAFTLPESETARAYLVDSTSSPDRVYLAHNPDTPVNLLNASIGDFTGPMVFDEANPVHAMVMVVDHLASTIQVAIDGDTLSAPIPIVFEGQTGELIFGKFASNYDSNFTGYIGGGILTAQILGETEWQEFWNSVKDIVVPLDNVVTYNGEIVTYNGEAVTYNG